MKKILSLFAFIVVTASLMTGCSSFGTNQEPPLTPGELVAQQIYEISKRQNIDFFHYSDKGPMSMSARRFILRGNMISYKPNIEEDVIEYRSLEDVIQIRIERANSPYPDTARSVRSIGLVFRSRN
ncbi:MAG: hypothetical protein Q3998_02535 [Porphyromonas sp.]|nr:hypothetical protein [Porphyromonas sp.]